MSVRGDRITCRCCDRWVGDHCGCGKLAPWCETCGQCVQHCTCPAPEPAPPPPEPAPKPVATPAMSIVCKRPRVVGPIHPTRRLVFGTDTVESVVAEFAHQNPMVAATGPGPDGAVCGTCRHFERHRQSVHWFKCGMAIRVLDRNPDWKAGFAACAKYEPATADNPQHNVQWRG